MQRDSTTELVQTFYRAALGRPADEPGLRHHVQLLKDGIRDPATMLNDMLSGPEARSLRACPPDGVNYIGLGSHCYVAWKLKGMGVKRASYPFDWLFSNAGMVAHCLSDDFRTFLDPSFYAASHDTNATEHMFYRSHFDVDDVFAHHDPRNEEDYAYFVRCVDRFRSLLSDRGNTVLPLVSRGNLKHPEAFERIADCLTGSSSGARLRLVTVLEPDKGMSTAGFFPIAERGSHRHVGYRPSSPLGSLGFGSPIDDAMVSALFCEA